MFIYMAYAILIGIKHQQKILWKYEKCWLRVYMLYGIYVSLFAGHKQRKRLRFYNPFPFVCTLSPSHLLIHSLFPACLPK